MIIASRNVARLEETVEALNSQPLPSSTTARGTASMVPCNIREEEEVIGPRCSVCGARCSLLAGGCVAEMQLGWSYDATGKPS